MKSGFKALITALGLGLALGGASIAQADDYGYRTWDRQEQHRHHDRGRDSRAWAKVTRVEPIYTTVRVAEPIEECWQERAPAGYHAGYESHTPTVVGGLIGGLLGNQVGQGTGNVLATVGGALLGGSVGRDVGRAHDRGPGYY
ncbi:MAG: glycine zipper 2TM domain-containing protein, partial [Gammaproteobacteria bacterium]|nr:glycine zipper 2TM domain-containing protein [Gammaproteobacteria bacterium]